MKRFTLTTLTLAVLAMPLAASAATTFTFDPTGTAGAAGDISGLGSFDQLPGNALAINGANIAAGGTSQLLYQANLGSALNTSNAASFTNGTGGNYFTFVAGFTEKIDGVANFGNTRIASFSIDTSQPSFFRMYATSAAGNDLTGQGFTTGTLILSGSISAVNFTSSFNEVLVGGNRSATQPLDQTADGNQYGGITTVVGSGSTSLTANILFADMNYFPGFTATSLVLAMLNTTQKLPFSEVNPSALFSSNGIANGDVASNIGAQNGISGPNFQFQADANSSFDVTAVPEPGSLALVGVALGALGFAGRRRAAKKS